MVSMLEKKILIVPMFLMKNTQLSDYFLK